MSVLQPPGWPRPRGYANGIATDGGGTLVFVAGQIGWDSETGAFPDADLPGQVRRTLRNVLAVLAEAGGRAEHITRLTWYVTDRDEYVASAREIGAAYRELMGGHYPAMAVVQVVALVERKAKVEIEATAVVPR